MFNISCFCYVWIFSLQKDQKRIASYFKENQFLAGKSGNTAVTETY